MNVTVPKIGHDGYPNIEPLPAVLATSTWTAKKGRDALLIQWNATEKLENTSEHFASFQTMLEKGASSDKS